jgi:hypothetical protein
MGATTTKVRGAEHHSIHICRTDAKQSAERRSRQKQGDNHSY